MVIDNRVILEGRCRHESTVGGDDCRWNYIRSV